MNQTTAIKLTRQRTAFIAIVSLALLAATGCRSLTEPAGASFASVTIKNHTADEIAKVTTSVFSEDGYIGGKSSTGELVFQREASRATTLARDGVVATQGGARTMNRVKAQIVPVSDGVYRLQCQAYMVTGAGDSFFEDEVAMTNLRRAPYQSLLNKVEKQLK